MGSYTQWAQTLMDCWEMELRAREALVLDGLFFLFLFFEAWSSDCNDKVAAPAADENAL